MKERLRLWYDRLFPQVKKLPAGIFHFQSPPEEEHQYRLHLRIDPGGEGTLIVNARTVLHLNQTATEYAYFMIKSTPLEETTRHIKARYNVSLDQATKDYSDFSERIHTLIHTPDLAPELYLDFERVDPYSTEITAPYRLYCALTYKTAGTDKEVAPVDRVRRELTTEEWRNILEKAWNAGIPHVIFTGGEPTQRPDLPDLISIAENLGQVTGLITSGYRLSDPKYMHRLLQSGLDHIMLILDLSNEETMESLRDILTEDIFINVHLTIDRENSKTIFKSIDNLIEKGVNSFSLRIADESLKEKLHATRNYVIAKGMSLIEDFSLPYSQLHPLSLEQQEHNHPAWGAGKAWLYVEPDGDVLPEQGENRVLGNFLKDRWETIWKNASLK